MCLGLPMKVIEVNGNLAVAEADGVTREIGLHLVEDVKVGDRVMVHAGFAIEKMDEEEADEVLRLIKQYGIQSQ